MLSHEEARAFYDQFGSRQDSQGFYEDRATRNQIAHADLGSARRVFEFGCGTGRFAHEILSHPLAPEASYCGVDQSSTMVRLARERLEPFGERAQIRQSDGAPRIQAPDASLDRVICNYVLDLLTPDDIRLFLADAHRALEPGGLLCLIGLTWGIGPIARCVSWAWARVHALRPSWVGGCRPIQLLDLLSIREWQPQHADVVTAFGISSQIVITSRRPGEPAIQEPA